MTKFCFLFEINFIHFSNQLVYLIYRYTFPQFAFGVETIIEGKTGSSYRAFFKANIERNSSNTKPRNLPAFPSPRGFKKASCRRASLMVEDLEMAVKSKVTYLNVLVNLSTNTWKYFQSNSILSVFI